MIFKKKTKPKPAEAPKKLPPMPPLPPPKYKGGIGSGLGNWLFTKLNIWN